MTSEKIDEIVRNRQEKLKKLHDVESNVEKIQISIEKIEEIKQNLSEVSSNDPLIMMLRQQSEVADKIRRIDTSAFYSAYDCYMKKLQIVKNRFSRETLNISFVGAAGQGKSCVLQQISGLGGDVIPSAKGSDCTGAKSIISNAPEALEVKAEITFYSCTEILDIINDYLKEIVGNGDYVKYRISDLSNASNIPISEIDSKIGLDANAKGKLEQLKKYVEHINDDEIKSRLGQKLFVPQEEIEQYVAQHSSVDPGKMYYKYLGVKCANIICAFPKKDAGKIVLVDTKGLGDTAIKVEENMLYAAENDSDAIILMYRPDALRAGLGARETDIISKIQKRISAQYCEQLLFWVINRVKDGDGKNTDVIEKTKEDIINSKMAIAGVLDVDCMDHENVEKNLLSPVLSGLTERVEKVDGFIVKGLNDLAEDLIRKYKNIVSSLSEVFIDSASEDIKQEMGPEIRETLDIMLERVRKIFLELNEKRNKPSEEFQEECDKKLKNILKLVPSQEEVIELLKKGSINQIEVYAKCTNKIRISIIDDFMELDDILNQLVEQFKQSIVDALTDDDKGKLGHIVSKNDKNASEWIETFIEKIRNNTGDYPLITKAMQELNKFKISVEGFMIYEVRDKLDQIDLSLSTQTPQIDSDANNREKQSEDIIFWLDKAINEIFDDLGKELNELFKVPNRALFAAAKDFYDRATYSGSTTYKDVMTEWEYLYGNWIPDIWAEQYASKINSIEAYKTWKKVTQTIQDNSALKNIKM